MTEWPMDWRRRALLLLLLAGLTLGAGTVPAGAKSWVVYYDDEAKPADFAPYELIVLDSKNHPPLEPLKKAGKTLLGYLSLGEVESYRPWFKAVKRQKLLLQENVNWPGSFYVELRDARWRWRVIDDLVPAILARGFDGIFLDTLDNPAELERRDPVRYEGMTRAAAELVLELRRHFPRIKIMLNRAYEILPLVARAIDYELGEAVYTVYDFENKRNKRQPRADYRWQVEVLQKAKKANPGLEIMTLDYWDPKDVKELKRIYALQRANGFLPYVATVELDRIVPEPR